MEEVGGGGQEKKRRRTEIKPIADKASRNVTFSKRRTGLFRRIDALSQLHRFRYFVLVFSPAGRAYHAGDPSLVRRVSSADASASSSDPARADCEQGPEEEEEARCYLNALMKAKQRVADRIKILTGADVNTTSGRYL